MRAFRQSNFPLASPRASLRRPGGGGRAFTLIELIFVLALLAITALFVVASMGSFFRGRALNFEARRLLSLTHYAQSRAVSEGVPVILWVNPATSTYGIAVQSSFNEPDGDARAVTYATDPSLTLETPTDVVGLVSEQDDEKLGLTTEGLASIRFTPDGFFDDSSVSKITIRQGTGAGLELVPAATRLAYEIRPVSNVD
ncbi:MAG: prepilin-type N-terminal cleavage/methylation domain-containing protein [Opitutus sp.]|nr:prepilin-type N-terminal cleavage/methylation domain-containing protein [Opitutus sp.]